MYNCCYCKFKAVSLELLKRHSKSQHTDLVIAYINGFNTSGTCQFCKKSYSHRLLRHCRSCIYSPANTYEYKCTYCTLTLPTVSKLSFHVATMHFPNSVQECYYCKKIFNYNVISKFIAHVRECGQGCP